jgi:hypothetical protein
MKQVARQFSAVAGKSGGKRVVIVDGVRCVMSFLVVLLWFGVALVVFVVDEITFEIFGRCSFLWKASLMLFYV